LIRRSVIQGLSLGLVFSVFSGLYVQASENKGESNVKAVLTSLQQGGYVIVFRHGATNRDQADTDPLNYENTAKQRLLSDKGKEQAKQIGEAFQKLGIPLGKVYTSKFLRAEETGKLISRNAVTTTLDVTEGGLVVSPNENDRRAQALRKMIAGLPETRKNTLIVTHKPNIIDAFGKDWFDVKEGEASIFKPDGSGQAALVIKLQATEWMTAATP
jgi:phosphohistidine phosphatase SixA